MNEIWCVEKYSHDDELISYKLFASYDYANAYHKKMSEALPNRRFELKHVKICTETI